MAEVKTKRVLISILQLHKTAAGAMRNTFEQIRYFKSRGWEVHVICDLMNKGSVRAAGAIPHLTLKWPGTGTIRRKFYDWQAQLFIKLTKPDLVVGHGDLSNQDVLCLHNSVHLAHELIHGTPLPKSAEMWPIHTPQLRDRRFKHIIANSHLMRDDLIARFSIPPEQITVVYPAYNDDKFTAVDEAKRQEIRATLNVASHEKVIGLITSGNFRKRGVDVFLEALKNLPTDVTKDLRVWIVGKDKPVVNDVPVKVEFLPVREDVENYFRALDIFVLPARVEEFGRVQLEAMACGCPVITTNKVGAAELLLDEARQFILSPGDATGLTKTMKVFLQDEGLRKRLAALSVKGALAGRESALAPQFDHVFSPWPKS